MNSQHQGFNQAQQRLHPAVVIGDFKVMYRPGQAFEQARRKLAQQGSQLQETQHFLFARMPDTKQVVLIHQLTQSELDNNIGQYIMNELAPHGLMTSDSAFGAALVGVVNSTNPRDPASAWGIFSLNTLQRLREQIDSPPSEAKQDFITPFAHIYRYLFTQKVGTSLLDVGCACAFWPLLVAEREQTRHGRIVGADNRQEAITLSQNMAKLAQIEHVEFVVSDLLAPDFAEIGTFDTVTAIHLLEHLPEELLPSALDNLLKATRQRLIIAVPYEQEATVAYGHEQTFSHEKLEQWGAWCVEKMRGKGRSWCKDVMGGILTIEKQDD